MAICYLDENNSELFHDGTTPAALDMSMGQWMTDIPSYRYSHKGGEYDLSDINNIPNLVHEITLTHDDIDDDIVSWGNKGLFRRCLVGVTEAVDIDGKLWSKKDGESTGELSFIEFHNHANALGGGFDIIDYETHCKIAHLFYAKYANRNPQRMKEFGTGQDSYSRTIGTTSSLGNNDGKTSTQISFLGIEDFYGCKEEFMGGINGIYSTYYIYDGYDIYTPPDVSYREVNIGELKRDGIISKVYFGEYGDMIPIEVCDSFNEHYCDYCYVAKSGNTNVSRSSDLMTPYNEGVACFNGCLGIISARASAGSRLQYRGKITVVEDPAEFIAMPVGF